MKIVKNEVKDLAKKPDSAFGGRVSDWFDSFPGESFFPKELFQTDWNPKIDVVDKGGLIAVTADLPGVDEKDIHVTLEDRVLTIEGKRENEHEEKKDGYHRIERGFGSFSRAVRLPEGIDADKINAGYSKGVLKIEIAKSPEKAPKKLEVKVS
ncbi:MAG: Hsp20/alpha crystallin family protein [Brevinematales bacterium]|nr:Hsp20/alpha crystallin family protein [Brevinematales bacterium]